MDEVELLRKWGGPGPEPSEASITVARAAPQRSIEALGTGRPAFLSIRRLGGRLGRRTLRQASGGVRKVAVLAGGSTGASMVQPPTPLGLPRHPALRGLSVLVMVRA